MNTKNITATTLFIISLACFVLCTCTPGYDLPVEYPEPVITATLSIRDLKSQHTYAGKFDEITRDEIISGVVVADDRTGNFYKTIVIQDTTGGIAILINGLNLHNDYPVGRRLFVKVKGLLLFDYRGLMQLGAGIDQSDPSSLTLAGIPSSLCSRYIIKGTLNNSITPAIVSLDLLTKHMQNRYQNTLVQVNDMQLDAADTASTYAVTSALQARSVPIRNCSGDSLVLRNSAYASFAANQMPAGKGAACGIFTVFGANLQLMIRDPADLQLIGKRCINADGEQEEEPETAYKGGISLGNTAPFLIDFDDLSNGLPPGVTVRTGATASDSGNISIIPPARVSWSSTSGGFKNLASANTLSATASAAIQTAAKDRALGVRQVTATDKGVAFVFVINNTLGKKNINIEGVLQSLDPVGRITAWSIDYAIGSKPSAFNKLSVTPATLYTGGGTFAGNKFTAALPASANDRSSRVWIRVVALSSTSGSGTRPMSAIDNIRLYWE